MSKFFCQFLRSFFFLFLAFGFSSQLAAQTSSEDSALLLVNGKIITLDDQGSIADSVLIHRGRIVAVGDESGALASSAQVIDLDGRTVIPGLFDSHMHFIRATLRPGHDMRTIESAISIADLLDAIRVRAATVPKGEWITAIGGWDPIQFVGENRFPTTDELNSASPDHPFMIFLRANGPAMTNSLGSEMLSAAGGIEVGQDGSIAQGGQSIAAFEYLKRLQTDGGPTARRDRIYASREQSRPDEHSGRCRDRATRRTALRAGPRLRHDAESLAK